MAWDMALVTVDLFMNTLTLHMPKKRL